MAIEQFGYRQQLRRSLSLSDLIIYGMIFMIPIARSGSTAGSMPTPTAWCRWPTGGHAGDALHRPQLRSHGQGLSDCRLGVFLPSAASTPCRLHRRLGAAARLPADPAAALRVQRAGAEPLVPGDPQAGLDAAVPGLGDPGQPARHHLRRPRQPVVPDRRAGGPGDLPGGRLPGAGRRPGQRPADPRAAVSPGGLRSRPGDEGRLDRRTVVPRLRRHLHPRRGGQGRSRATDRPRR